MQFQMRRCTCDLSVWGDTFQFLLKVAEPTAAGPVSVYRVTGVVVSSVDETPVPHVHLNATLVTRWKTWEFVLDGSQLLPG